MIRTSSGEAESERTSAGGGIAEMRRVEPSAPRQTSTALVSRNSQRANVSGRNTTSAISLSQPLPSSHTSGSCPDSDSVAAVGVARSWMARAAVAAASATTSITLSLCESGSTPAAASGSAHVATAPKPAASADESEVELPRWSANAMASARACASALTRPLAPSTVDLMTCGVAAPARLAAFLPISAK